MISFVIVDSEKTRNLTDQTIDSIYDNTTVGFEIIVVTESVDDIDDAYVVSVNNGFGYNKFLNIGAKKCKGDYIVFCNNDLIFGSDWECIINQMKENNLDSASPLCLDNAVSRNFKYNLTDTLIKGNAVGEHLAGWCIVLSKEFFNKIEGFDEDFTFWCCDNAYREQLIKHNGKHALSTISLVNHLGSQTLDQLKGTVKYNELTFREVKKFEKKFKKKLF